MHHVGDHGYLILTFFIHHIAQSVSGFKNTAFRKISFITYPGILITILFVVNYSYRIYEIVTAIGVNEYVYYYSVTIVVLLYLIVLDVRAVLHAHGRAGSRSPDTGLN